MSGIAVAYGNAVHQDVYRMLDTMAHRGAAWRGVRKQSRAILGQNYAPADVGLTMDIGEACVADHGEAGLEIAYDGQIGNWSELARDRAVPEGPRRDERLLLELYREYGAEMLRHLGDAVFAFSISDGDRLFVARDVLGIKTLFYGLKDDAIYFGSELKSVLAVADDVYEFPAGHCMDSERNLTRFADLVEPARMATDTPEQAAQRIRDIVWRSVCNRVSFEPSTAGLLSGGLDSSVVCGLAARRLREQCGQGARLRTFAIGVGESEDVRSARLVADHIDSEHRELIVDLEQVVESLPQVIYSLESFDPSLVRSSVSNYLISQYAREHGVEQLLSGEGGDEIFCGYLYLKEFPAEQLVSEQLKCLGYLHSNASLRLDRMNQCHGVRVVAPLVSGELLDYALRLPPEYKQKSDGENRIEKWIFRKAYESLLPENIVWRGKQEFSQGSGSAGVLPAYFEKAVSDEDFARARIEHPIVRSKEELYYFRIFTEYFGFGRAVDTVGQWVSL